MAANGVRGTVFHMLDYAPEQYRIAAFEVEAERFLEAWRPLRAVLVASGES